jgi:hypothetical protein
MKEVPEHPYQVERLNPEEFQKAREQNLIELERRSKTRIYIIEETKTYPDRVEFSYGWFTHQVPIQAKDQIRLGSKILIVQHSDDETSPVEAVYALGENLLEQSSQPPAETPQ